VIRADPMVPSPGRVERVTRETPDTFTLEIAASGGAFPPFAPGQFSMLYAFGVGEAPISISGDPSERGRLRYTVRAVGPVTEALVTRKRDEEVGVRGPFGRGWPLDEARGRDVLLVAGGIGLAPLRPVLYHLLRDRDDYGVVTLLYGARSPKEILYGRELRAWSARPRTQILTTVDYADLRWRGNVGVVTRLFTRVRIRPDATVAMVCGPEIMMRHVADELSRRGLPPERGFLSMERNMACGSGFCGHCQLGPHFVCKDGPVFPYGRLQGWMNKHEI
jgi:NAD(P)H-flavin reductase